MIDPAKLSETFEAHAAALKLYARQWVRDAEGADDVVHEVFLSLIARKTEPDDVPAWIFAAVRNRAISAVRSRQRRSRRESRAARVEMFEQRIEDLIDARAAEAGIQELTLDLREIVVLRIWGGMRFAQIAELTGLSVSTAFDHYRAALAMIRQSMEQSTCTMNSKAK